MAKLLIIFCLLCLSWPVYALTNTISTLRQAFLEKDLKTINQHVALEGIVGRKLGKLNKPLLAKAACRFVRYQYMQTNTGTIINYLANLKINKISTRQKYAYAAGSFLGKPIVLSAVKVKNRWVIVGVSSPIIDHEIRYLKKLLHLKKN